MPVCFVFGHCFLALPQPLFLLLEKRFGPIKGLMSSYAQHRNSFWANLPRRRSSRPDALPMGVDELEQHRIIRSSADFAKEGPSVPGPSLFSMIDRAA
jgi:hypothetical protein